MALKKIVKVLSLLVLAVVASSCLEKADTLITPNQEIAPPKLWQWDDQQKSWLFNGALFTPKVSESPASMWKKQDNAILLRVESVKSLTMFDNAPKALQMKVFQLSDPKAFLQAAKSSSGLKHLLVTEPIDPAILNVERLIVLPGVSQSISLARSEGAHYIGIVLGYASLKQEKIFRLIPIVTLNDEIEKADADNLLSSVMRNKQPSVKEVSILGRPAVLKVVLSLEADGINKLEVDAR